MGRESQAPPLCQILPLSLLKWGLIAPKLAKIGNFWYKFTQKRYTPLSNFIKFGLGEGVPDPLSHTKFHRSGIKRLNIANDIW